MLHWVLRLLQKKLNGNFRTRINRFFLFFKQGTVIIIANEGERIEIPPCSLLENKIVTGNLRILDH